MKHFLILTGTTGYPMLEKAVLDIARNHDEYSFVLQTKNDVPACERVTHEKFIHMENLDYHAFDGIIGHCGAGTTFWTLDRDIRFLAVVDLDRIDSHQQDLGGWLEKHNHALVIYNKPITAKDLDELTTREFSPFEKEGFMFSKFDALCAK